MSYFLWILLFAINCIFCLWVLRWGGAEWMEGGKSSIFINWLYAFNWSAEQIKLYVLLSWVGHLIWFVVGLFVKGLRMQV